MTIEELEKFNPGTSFYDVKDQLKRFIYSRSDEIALKGDYARDCIKNKAQLESHTADMRKEFMAALGELPSMNTPLNAKNMGTISCEKFRIEKIIFESRPGTYVTANLYIPFGITKKRGAVLFVCGHSKDGKHQDEYQIVCTSLVNKGLVVLAMDSVGLGERLSYYESTSKTTTIGWGTYEHDYAGSQCWPIGDAIARYFVHDAMRGVDYLCTRPEVNPKRIGVTGNSGGGTLTSLMMIFDTRIAAAVPATNCLNSQAFMYTGRTQDSENVWPGMGAHGFSHDNFLMAMVPKPVLVLAVTSDFFPIEGTRRAVEMTRRFWEMYNKGDNIGIFEDDSTHKYTRAMADAAADFFSIHLLDKSNVASAYGSLKKSENKSIEASLLWCTESGQTRGEIEGAQFVFEENLKRLEELTELRNKIPDHRYKEEALLWLREKVFYNRAECELNPRNISVQNIYDLTIKYSVWWSQKGIMNFAAIFRNNLYADRRLPITIALWDGGSSQIQAYFDWIYKTCSSGRTVMILNVSGAGSLIPNSFGTKSPMDFRGVIYQLNHLLMWQSDSITAMRTYDVIRALDLISTIKDADNSDIQVFACGRSGIYARLAAALDLRIKKIEVSDGITSYAQWVGSRHYNHYDISSIILPGVLKHFDLTDIDKWNAERNNR